MSQAQVTDIVASDEDRLARHLEWQRAMQEAVACALDEHRAKGHSIAVLRESTLPSIQIRRRIVISVAELMAVLNGRRWPR